MNIANLWLQIQIIQQVRPVILEKLTDWWLRLLGDAVLPVEQRKTNALFGPGVCAGLESSGLLGAVKIDVLKY